jgi:hypothetical protein
MMQQPLQALAAQAVVVSLEVEDSPVVVAEVAVAGAGSDIFSLFWVKTTYFDPQLSIY